MNEKELQELRDKNEPAKEAIIRALDAEHGNYGLIKELTDRVEDFNNVIDSILSASGGRRNVILEKEMLEILREHKALNNRALKDAKK